jgi:hypothetical protein
MRQGVGPFSDIRELPVMLTRSAVIVPFVVLGLERIGHLAETRNRQGTGLTLDWDVECFMVI